MYAQHGNQQNTYVHILIDAFRRTAADIKRIYSMPLVLLSPEAMHGDSQLATS